MSAHNTPLVLPVLLCGGSGVRLWPLSRLGFPKQFLSLTSTESLFQQAAKRLTALDKAGKLILVTSEDHRFLATEQLRETGVELGVALLEPMARNTAPALTVAALTAVAEGADPILIVAPADHSIADPQAFNQTLRLAAQHAAENKIVVLGVVPHRPETGYGYIKALPSTTTTQGDAPRSVVRFAEKPDVATAQGYLDEGDYFWNAGIFVLKASVWLAAIARFRQDIFEAVKRAWEARQPDASLPFVRFDSDLYAQIPSESIDYAVMERCPALFPVVMVPLNTQWSDLGSWEAVWQEVPKDGTGNAHLGDVLSVETSNTLTYAASRLVSLVGVKDLVVIETPDAVLVMDKSRSQGVKHIVSLLEQRQRDEHTQHRKIYRPWGWYNLIDEGEGFKAKRIYVKPKASLSLQKHRHRAEHWVVVRGTAEVVCGEKKMRLEYGVSTYIPLGEVHRLTNPGDTPLEIIEVQSGTYFGEDDIIRIEDNYQR